MYSKNVKKWLVPFLRQCERKTKGTYNSLLRDYIVTTANTDLTRPLKVFELSKIHVSLIVKFLSYSQFCLFQTCIKSQV